MINSIEFITCSAININWCIVVWKRHWNCFIWLSKLYAEPWDVPQWIIQWFYTDKFRFIEREEALKLAKKNWQYKWDNKSNILFSEDLR